MMRWKDDFVGNTQRKCVHVHHNGDFEHGKVLYMEPDWTYLDFLNAASQRLNMVPTARRLFNADGITVDDCMMIEDNDILFLSINEDFIAPNNISSNSFADPAKNSRSDDKIPTNVGGYKVGDILGKGGFGEVRVAEHQLTGEKVALKFLRKSDIHSLGAAERTNTEIQCLTALRHTNIIRLHQHTESANHIVLVFELMEGGDLMKYLIANKERLNLPQACLSEEECKHVFYQVLSGISFAHNQHICHRDLKLENILLKDHTLNLVKIADFGLSDFYRPGTTMKSTCGTLSFLSPEVFKGTSNAGPPLDVWSLGVILFAMLCGRLPFEGTDFTGSKRPRDSVIKTRIIKCQYKIDEHLGPEAKDLIRRMLQVDPAERATIPEIFNHVWVRSASVSHYGESFLSAASTSGKMHTALSSNDLSLMMAETQISPVKTHRKGLSLTGLEKSPSDSSLFGSPLPYPLGGAAVAAMKSPRSKDSTPVGSYQSNGRFLLASPREGIAGSAVPEESPSSIRSEQHMFHFPSVTREDSDSGKSLDKQISQGSAGIASVASSTAPSPAMGVSTATAASGAASSGGGNGNGGTVISTFKLVPLRRGNSNKDADLEYSPRTNVSSTPPMLSSEKRSNSDNANMGYGSNQQYSSGTGSGGVGGVSGSNTRPHTAVHSRIGPASSAAAALSAMDDEIFSLNNGHVNESNRKSYPRKEPLNTNNNTRSNANLFSGIAGQSEHKHGGGGVAPKRHSTSDTLSPNNPHARRDNEKRLSTNALVHSIFDHSVGTSSPEAPSRGRTTSNPVNIGGRVRFN